MSGSALYPLLGIVAGAVVGGGIFLLVMAVRGMPAGPRSARARKLDQALRDVAGVRGAVALVLGALTLLATRWVVAAIGVALLCVGWRSLGGASSERRAIARLEGLAAWTESLRDTIAGAVGLEQAIPSSLRAAAPSLQEPLTRLVDRLHTRMPMPEALRRFADDLGDPGADLIIAALIINSRLRGPGLRDLLGGLSTSVREELDMRRKINADRRATRRSVQIVVIVAVAVALLLGVFNHSYVSVYDAPLGQIVLIVVAAFYAAGFFWLRKLARFDAPERLLAEPLARGRGQQRAGDGGQLAGRRLMTAAIIAGAVAGAGIFLLIVAVAPRRVSLSRQLAAFDARPVVAPPVRRFAGENESELTRRLGTGLAAFCREQGWEFPGLRNDLALAGKSFENFLATSVLLAVFGFLLGPILLLLLAVLSVHLSFVIPIWLGLVLAVIFSMLTYVEVKQKAAQRRKDFRHAVGAFLDLVGMNLAGGRGVPEALMAASEIGGGWSMWRIRDALANARITGQTPWQALGALGEEIRVDELRDLAAALSLVAEDGAKVRESLTARAVSLRRRELADLEGQAGERSQSMLVAQMFLVAGFLVFLVFPVVGVLLGVQGH